MKLNDALWGALLMLFGGALLLHVQGFPRIPGQSVGPALFPGVLAVGLAAGGLLLVVRGLRARAAGGDGSAWWAWPAWAYASRQRRAFLILVGVNVFYVMAIDRLGFVLTGTIYLAALMWSLRVRLARAVPMAIVLTLLVHYAFYKLLRVPLPWGVLQPVAW